MANLDRPRGFEPHGEIKQVVVQEAGSACFPGDMVALASDGQVDPVATGAKVLGLCLSYASAAGQKFWFPSILPKFTQCKLTKPKWMRKPTSATAAILPQRLAIRLTRPRDKNWIVPRLQPLRPNCLSFLSIPT
jgi:hypothetical protein